MIKRVELFGFNFISEANITTVVDDILKSNSYEENGKYPFLITPNIDYLVNFSKSTNKELKATFLNSAYILPDGQPIIFASKLFKNKLPKRLAGSDLLPLLWNESKAGFKVLALTSSENISGLLQKDNTNSICYTLPFFDLNDKDTIQKITNECADILLKENIKIVIIGISFPKQDILALNIYNRLKELNANRIPLFCMLGASFEFYLKLKKRAPVFLQKIGFEWLYRFSTEPKRLFKRYFIDDVAFLPILFKEFLKK
jgi:N-acetylglucosaminyldiphosphoundecaprenol N-acetyl-beta-D-mannosaminyltransferase